MHVVKNTRLPQTMGDDHPRPGTSVFQATFSVADQCSGGWALASEAGCRHDRNCGTLADGSTLPSMMMKNGSKTMIDSVCTSIVLSHESAGNQVYRRTFYGPRVHEPCPDPGK